ncbi:MAG: hypothetical protein HGA85_00765, partial [Nanoarchaeota archaeon]|nr:hypothetical protein [Nanoarchaeota archaeon]
MPQGSAVNDILQMRQQGLSNNQVIQNLQRAGYTNTQIFDAMNQADTKMAVEGFQPAFMQHSEPPAHELFTQPPQDAQSSVQGNPINSLRMDSGSSEKSNEKIEELVEAIIEEKWTEIVRDVNKIIDWKNKVETRLSDMEIKLDSLRDNFSDLNRAIVS